MPVEKEMFNRDKMGCNLTRIHKTGTIARSKLLSNLPKVVDAIKELHKGRFLYDITYDGDVSFDTLTGTEFLSNAVYCHPCNFAVRDSQILAASKDYSDNDVIKKILSMSPNLDKYDLIKKPFIGDLDAVVFVPGSNLFDRVVDIERVTEAVKNGAIVKPHPITNAHLLRKQQHLWGKKNVALPKSSGWDYLQSTETVFSLGCSEMGIYAAMLRKTVLTAEKFQTRRNPSYRPLFNLVLDNPNPYQALNNVFNSNKSGIFFVWDDEEKIKQYLAFAAQKVEQQKNE